jgi:uncharacterized protein YoxC
MQSSLTILSLFGGFLLIFFLLLDPIKAITISILLTLMIEVLVYYMIKPLVDKAANEAVNLALSKLDNQINKGITHETQALYRYIKSLVYDMIYKR